MKKTLLISAAMMALAVVGCQKNSTPEEPQGDPIYTLATDDPTVYELTQGKSKTIAVYAKTTGGVVASMLEATIKVDETKVAEYNKTADTAAVILPSKAYTLKGTILKIYTNNKKSLSEQVTINALTEMADTHYVLPITISQITGSDKAKLVADPTVYIVLKKRYTKIDKGDGSKEKPYLIYDAKDLWEIHDNCKQQGEDTTVCTYYKMMADVDLKMTQADTTNWEPLNYESPYDKKINFDGNGHTIKNIVSKTTSYVSLFGVVYGYVHDLTVENAYIEGGHAIGVVGGYVGTSGKSARVERVFVKNSIVNNISGSKNGVGGFCGRVQESEIIACSFEGTVISIKDFAGGIFGYDVGTSVISNCSSSGIIKTQKQKAGGIGGGLIKAESKIMNCFTTMGIYSTSSSGNAGGIVGACNQDKTDAFYTPNNEISGCLAWNDSISVRTIGPNNWSCGAIISFTAPSNIMKKCYRRNGLELLADNPESQTMFKFSDHSAEYGPGALLPVNCDFTSDTPHVAKYDGVEAAAGVTASSIAKEIGWSTNIWDLTGSVPVLKSSAK